MCNGGCNREWPKRLMSSHPNRCHNCRRNHRRSGYDPGVERRAHLRRTYGVTPEIILAKLEQQDYACAICNKRITMPSGTGGLRAHKAAFDHDHATGKERDLLCTRCNTGIGLFRENVAALRRAADYLIRHWGHDPSDEHEKMLVERRETRLAPENPDVAAFLEEVDTSTE